MSEQSRALPDRPSVRYLKIEAKRRLAAGEFTSLHEAQLAVAREHGFPSWAALKESIDNPALVHVRWVANRFQGADDGAWVAPRLDELREHFDDQYLSLVPAEALVRVLRGVAGRLGGDLVVSRHGEQRLRAQIADLRVEAAADPEPPHRLTSLRMFPVAARVTDPRVAVESAARTVGAVPERAARVAEESYGDLGLPGLVLAGSVDDGSWAVARGWAELDRPEALRTEHRFPAYGVAKLVTSTAVLRLVAEAGVDLDAPANRYLSGVRLADGEVTVRELLTHTGGVASGHEPFADRVPDLVDVLGATVPVDGRRGTLAPSNAGYAVLGQLIADVTGAPYAAAVTALVLLPLGMRDSSFPTGWPDGGAVTGYRLTDDGSYVDAPRQVSVMPAAGGLWTTAADLVRFGRTWSTLLSGALRDEALRPHAAQPVAGTHVGLGWLVNPSKDVIGHQGAGPAGAASLLIRQSTGAVGVACANRLVPLEPVTGRLIRPIA